MTYNSQIRSVVFFWCKSMFHYPLVGSEVLSTITGIVTFTPAAVHQLLLWQSHQLFCLQCSQSSEVKYRWYNNNNKCPKVIWQKAASPTCHSLQMRMDSSALDPYLTHYSLDPHESAPKRHLNWFIHFCTAHPCAQIADCHPSRRWMDSSNVVPI